MSIQKIRVVHEPSCEEPFAVVYKPHGLPSAPLSEGDKDNAFCYAAELFPELFSICGKKEIEHGLLHRLDNEASGLLLIASTQQSYDSLCEAQKNGKFEKMYSVTCRLNKKNADSLGCFPPVPDSAEPAPGQKIILTSSFRPYGEGRKQVRPVTGESGKAACRKGGMAVYKTEIKIIDIEKTTVITRCRITAGYRHQVRCHLAWQGIPALGDRLYNALHGSDELMQFEGSGISFPHPLTGVVVVYTIT
jgi:23S rRNA pseudouridine1911/1915/1917 synthase